MREQDIRPADLLAEYLRLSSADAARFFPDPGGFRARACPGCGAAAPAGAPEFTKNGFPFARCPACATLYARAVPNDEGLAAFYRDSPSQRYWGEVFFPAVAEARRERIFRPRVARVRGLCAELGLVPQRVVDVGAGAGLFLAECRTGGLGTELTAIEPSAALAGRLAADGFATFAGFADQAAADPAWAGRADLAVSFEVIEHTTDPGAFLAAMAALVRPGGLVLASGLCGTGFDILVLGARSNAVSPPHHLTFLSRRGAEAALGRVGLEPMLFLTPGALDVDIVANALKEDPAAVADPFLRHLLTNATDAARQSFQEFLAASGLSSHMWLVARRPG